MPLQNSFNKTKSRKRNIKRTWQRPSKIVVKNHDQGNNRKTWPIKTTKEHNKHGIRRAQPRPQIIAIKDNSKQQQKNITKATKSSKWKTWLRPRRTMGKEHDQCHKKQC
jgi:hypothetical protein